MVGWRWRWRGRGTTWEMKGEADMEADERESGEKRRGA